jgi:hypothetical protein
MEPYKSEQELISKMQEWACNEAIDGSTFNILEKARGWLGTSDKEKRAASTCMLQSRRSIYIKKCNGMPRRQTDNVHSLHNYELHQATTDSTNTNAKLRQITEQQFAAAEVLHRAGNQEPSTSIFRALARDCHA